MRQEVVLLIDCCIDVTLFWHLSNKVRKNALLWINETEKAETYLVLDHVVAWVRRCACPG